MAYKTLSTEQRAIGRAFVHDVFCCAGVATSRRTKENPFAMYDLSPNGAFSNVIRDCKTITDCITDGTFTNIDHELERLAKLHFNPSFTELKSAGRGFWVKKDAPTLAKYLADFCAVQGFYWDDSLQSANEMDEFCNTIFGKALQDFGCFTSQPLITNKAMQAASTASIAGTGSTARSAGQPANDYKSTGPQSGNVRDLISVPGQKEIFKTTIFSVEGENSKAQKVKAFAFIKPLSPQGEANGTNKIFVGSSNGYTDCKIYVTDVATADDLKSYCQSIAGSNITNLTVVKKSPDSNGYYKVNTEFGPVYIPAKKLNEAKETAECDVPQDDVLTEAATLTEEQKEQAWKDFSARLDAFDDNFRRYY